MKTLLIILGIIGALIVILAAALFLFLKAHPNGVNYSKQINIDKSFQYSH